MPEGCAALTGGGRALEPHLADGFFVKPTIFTGVSNGFRIAREEVFGPVLSIISFDTEEDAIRIANDTIYGLAANVWTGNGGSAHKLASRIRSGTVWINCHNVFDASLPFGGYKQSGWGREMGEEVFHNYTEINAVTAAL